MKHKLLFSFLLITQFAIADVGDPWVQAVCKVTMKDGKTIEGLIKLGSGGYFGIFVNGFNIRDKHKQQIYDNTIFFDLDFRIIRFTDSTIERPSIDKLSNSINGVPKDRQITFVEWIENPYYNYNSSLPFNDSLIIINHHERHYRLKDSLTIYFDITLQSFLDSIDVLQNSSKKISYVTIAVNQIEQFELIEHPDKFWIDKIELSRTNFYKYENSGTGDWQPAAWFHELAVDKALYNEYQSRIKHNLDRY